MTMRVLIISQGYDPEPNVKSHGLALALRGAGHDVEVLTAFPNYPYGRIYPGYRQKAWSRESMDHVHLIRIATFMDHSRSALRRSLCYGSFVVMASVLGSLLPKRPDVVWAYETPFHVGIPAIWLGLRFRAPVVLDIQDIWPETLQATGFSGSGWLYRLIGKITAMMHRHAAALVVPSEGFRKNVVGKGASRERVEVIPNWADESMAHVADADLVLAEAEGLAGKFNVVFAGNMGAAQGLETVIQAARILKNKTSIQFVFIGDGLEKASIERMAQDLGLTNVRFLGRKPPTDMPFLFALSDALLVHLRREPPFDITIPTKIMAYLGAGRPILCGVEGDAAAVVTTADAGLVFPSEDPEAMASAALRLFDMAAEGREEMGRLGLRAFRTHFTREAVSADYVKFLEGIFVNNKVRRL